MTGFTRRDMFKITAGAGLTAFMPSLFGCNDSSANESVVLRVPIGPTPVQQMDETVYGPGSVR